MPAPSPLLWVRVLPPPSCNSSALIMTLVIKESVKQRGIANEQELIGPSRTKWLHSSTMNYKTGGGHKKEEENEGWGSSAGLHETGEEQENTMTVMALLVGKLTKLFFKWPNN